HADQERARVCAAPRERGRPLQLRADGVRLCAHRQPPHVSLRRCPAPHARLRRLPRQARDEHHGRRPSDLRCGHRRGQDRGGLAAQRKTAWEIAEQYTEAFRDDLRRLNIVDPSIWCRATDHIPEQIAFIQCIEAKGFAYRTSDGIYFDTSRLDDYGYLARLD